MNETVVRELAPVKESTSITDPVIIVRSKLMNETLKSNTWDHVLNFCQMQDIFDKELI